MNFEFMTIDTPLPPCMPFPRALTGFPVSSTAKVMYCRMLDAREWNRNLPIFRVLSAAQYRFQHIAHSGASLLASMTAFPYLAIMVA